jgi:hypothetical protein
MSRGRGLLQSVHVAIKESASSNSFDELHYYERHPIQGSLGTAQRRNKREQQNGRNCVTTSITIQIISFGSFSFGLALDYRYTTGKFRSRSSGNLKINEISVGFETLLFVLKMLKATQ